MSTFTPLTVKWPWLTSWRAMRRVRASPARYTTLSSRLSRIRSRFSPVLPECAVGLFVVAAELLLHDAVGEAGLLLLLQLRAVFALLDPRAAVLAGRVGALLERLIAADEVDAEAARLAGDGSGVTSHVF